MKPLIKPMTLMLLFSVIALFAHAQENLPKREFKLGVSASNIVLSPGQATRMEVNIYRSRSYSNKEIALLVSSLPDGLSVEYDKQNTTDSVTWLTFRADPSMKAGKYTILLHGKTSRVTKGITFSVSVNTKEITKN